ncbi:MAG: lipoate--protein ligase [Syntrophothermus sp.]
MILIQWPDTDAYFNLAAEEYVFSQLDRQQEYLLLWQNRNAIVVGVHQNTCEEINPEFVEQNDVQVVRRLTGGGAVYHDMGNLNFSFIVNVDGKGFNFRLLAQPVVQTLNRLGVAAEFNRRNDLTIGGLKISGNAETMRGDRLLHHGTLLFNSNLETLSAALKVKGDKIESKGIKSVRSRVTNIQDHLPGLTVDTFKEMLREEIGRSNRQITEYAFTETDRATIAKLREEKYSTWNWNYGRSPNYNIKKERRFNGGGLSLYMTVHQGLIQSCRIFGDFFGEGELSDIEQHLVGAEMREDAVGVALDGIDIPVYIHGLSTEEFIKMLVF